MSSARKILVVRFSSIGDIILTSPVYRCLKQQLNAEVHLLVKRAFSYAVAGNPYIDKVIEIKSAVNEVADELRDEGYDHIVDLHHNLRSMQVKRLLGTPSTSVEKLNIDKWLLVNLKWDRMPKDPHMVRRNIATIEPLGAEYDGKGLDFFIPKDQEVDLAQYPNMAPGGFVALTIATSTPTRSMESSQLEQLVEMLQLPVALLGGPGEAAVGESIANQHGNVVNLAGKMSLQQSASVIQQSAVLVAPDTSLMHIGAALDHPMVTVWGSTVERFGMTPFYPEGSGHKWEMIQVEGLKCRPCSKIGHKKCPKGHFRCMRDIDLAKMADSIHLRMQ